MRFSNLKCPTYLGLIICFFFGNASLFAQNNSGWGIESDFGLGFGKIYFRGPFVEGGGALNNRVWGGGIVRFKRNNAPNFSFGYIHNDFRVNGFTNYVSSRIELNGGISINGMILRKYFTPLNRNRFSGRLIAGLGLGFIKFSFAAIQSDRSFNLGRRMFFVPFEVLGQTDFRLGNKLFFGPFGGIKNGFPVSGGVLRYRL